MSIIYLKGDATQPQGEGQKIICHICNDVGKWGKGFVMALSKRWKKPERHYRRTYKYEGLTLGTIGIVTVEKKIEVINMVAQHGVYPHNGIPPIRYDALQKCLSEVDRWLQLTGTRSIHMPRIGCGLAGGEWDKVENVIKNTLSKYQVYVYDLK